MKARTLELPPTIGRRSSTRVRRPAFARYEAFVSPLWPPPMTIASYDRSALAGLVPFATPAFEPFDFVPFVAMVRPSFAAG